MTETIETFELSAEQKEALKRIEGSTANFFITGKAGTGKSVLLCAFTNSTRKKVAVVAPTGIAAINVGGQTIHSFFGLEPSLQNPFDKESVNSGLTPNKRKLLSELDTLVIDEISMVRVDVMDMIDQKMRIARCSDLPFGGCQLVMVGDLYQLPPVVKEIEVERWLQWKYQTVYFFGAPAFHGNQPVLIELTNVFRQSEGAFIGMLNHIRVGDFQHNELQRLNSRRKTPPADQSIITLTPTVEAAQQVNNHRLNALPGETYVYKGVIEGEMSLEDLPTEKELILKKNAQILMLKNDTDKRWVNGSVGRIVGLSENTIRVAVNDGEYDIDKDVWTKYAYEYDQDEQTIRKREVGCFRQYPLRLAYAVTIHKAQGQTFDAVVIDYSDSSAFATGQTYVALSRCRSFDGLYLTAALEANDVRVSQEVVNYMLGQKMGGKITMDKNMEVLYGQKFSDSAASLPKEIRSKLQITIKQLLNNPELPGLHVEKIGQDDLYSARIDDNYRMIFSACNDQNILSLLYVGPHEEAYRFAGKYKVAINPLTGGLQQVEKAPKRISSNVESGKRFSRLNALSDAQLVAMDIPEEYWQQLREKVYSSNQLIGFKSLFPSETYETLGFILDGTPVDEAIELWESMTASVVPAEAAERTPLFSAFSAEELVSVGIPEENVDKVKRIKTDKELEIIAQTLPVLAQQSLYALRSGETIEDVRKTTFASAKKDRVTDNAITMAEFAPIDSEEALNAILEFPSEKWRVFLHPTQTEVIQRDYNGPARIIGGAGTGKTVVIVHRAKRLAHHCVGNEKVLVTTYGKTLEQDIYERLKSICSPQELDHIDVKTVDKLTFDLVQSYLKQRIAYESSKKPCFSNAWRQAMQEVGTPNQFDTEFCMAEWQNVIQLQNILTLDDYLTAQRAGRGRQFDKTQRQMFWKVCEQYRTVCMQQKITDVDWAQNRLAAILQETSANYKSIIIDECQDLRAPALRMLRALAGEQHENDMYLSGDSRQRIYDGRVSMSQCGIMINNRSRVLKLNYRTTEEIYNFAMKFQQDYQYDDLDGKEIAKDKSNCIFHGPEPLVRGFDNRQNEIRDMVRDIKNLPDSVDLSDVCVMVRTVALLNVLEGELANNGLKTLKIDNKQHDDKSIAGVRVMTMHRGKGMEFSYVYLPGLNDDVIPNKREMDKAEDDEMRREQLLKEANLLSVAVTRAKRKVWLSYSGKPSSLIKKMIDEGVE